MYHEYNVKKRVFSNGLCQVRIFQKAVILGNVKDSIKKTEYEMLEIPFEQEPVKSRKFLDSEGFSIPVEYDKPLRTLENWENGQRKCPIYVEKLIVEKILRDSPIKK